MRKLEKTLADWVGNELLSDEQATRILAFEKARPGGSWVLYGFLMLGVVVLAIGIISLIAANWPSIPGLMKIFLDFLLLAGLGTGVWYARERQHQMLAELILLFYMLLCLASIGLISQVYHTGGELYEALLFWSLITVSLVGLSQKALAPFLWTTGFFAALLYAIIDTSLFDTLFQRQIIVVFMTLPLFAALLAVFARGLGGNEAQVGALRFWVIIVGLAAMAYAEVELAFDDHFSAAPVAYIPAYVSALGILAGIVLTRQYTQVQKILLGLALLFYLLPFHLIFAQMGDKYIAALISITLLGVMAALMASLGRRILFNLFLVALGLRFLVLYFQALGSLALTGMGLVGSGIIIILMAVLWHKYRKAVIVWVEARVQ